MALAAPLLLALPLLVNAATVVRRAHGPARAFTVVPGGLPQPEPWKPPFQLLVFTAVLLLAGTVVWLLLLPRILRAVRQLAQLTRWLAGEWCGVRIAGPASPRRPAGEPMSSGSAGCWATRPPAARWCGGRQRRRRMAPAPPACRADHAGADRAHRARGPLAGHVPAAWFPR